MNEIDEIRQINAILYNAFILGILEGCDSKECIYTDKRLKETSIVYWERDDKRRKPTSDI